MLAAAKEEIRSKLEVISTCASQIRTRTYLAGSVETITNLSFSSILLFNLYFQNARQVTDATQLEQMMAEGKEAAAFLRSAIVQATANDRGHIGKLLALVENQIPPEKQYNL